MPHISKYYTMNNKRTSRRRQTSDGDPIVNTVIRNGVYHYRKRIPKHIAHLLPDKFKNKKEIYITLKTRKYDEALRDSLRWDRIWEDNFAKLKAQIGITSTTDYIEVRAAAIFNTANNQHIIPPHTTSQTNQTSTPKHTIKDVYDSYLLAKQPKQAAKKDWHKGWEYFLGLSNLNWDSDIQEVTPDALREFFNKSEHLPTYPNRKIFKGKTPLEMVEICKKDKTQKTITAAAYNKHHGGISVVCKHAVEQRYLSDDPSRGFRREEKDSRTRLPYDEDDMKKIFSHSIFKKPKEQWDEYQWIPLFGFFQGMRLEESGQLLLSDIKSITDAKSNNIIWYFAVTEYDEEGERSKDVKSGESRNVPIHKKIIELGFLDYLARAKKSKKASDDTRLFPNLKLFEGRTTHYFSKWWGRQRGEFGISSKQKVFHSSRHTFIDATRETDITTEIRDAITGHKTYVSVAKEYGIGTSIRKMKEAIDKVSYSDEIFINLI